VTQPILEYIDANRDRFLEELKTLLKMPSISTSDEHVGDVRRCADWLANHLESIGVRGVEIQETPRHPIVFARHIEDPALPTFLLYGHYDVQPPDPLDLWETPPFEPSIRDGRIYARGATDDKGQVFAHLKALEAHLAVRGSLPVNLLIVIEGEEEIGSPNLESWVRDHQAELDAEAVIISDTSMFAPGVPAIMYALRGLCYFEISVRGPSHDLHSGLYGGGVCNPINALTQILGSFHDDQGRVNIPGFYDDVRPLTEEERSEFAAHGIVDEVFLEETGVSAPHGEVGYSTLERTTARPTLDCNGIIGGFTGRGAKTVLPSHASAKFSCRLVPDQAPGRIEGLVVEHIKRIAPPAVEVEITHHHGGYPVITERDHPAVQASVKALTETWEKAPVFIRGGGSIPVVATFSDVLQLPSVLIGFGLTDDRLHSPNEKLDLACYFGGIQTSARLWDELARTE
jgi:acetylornithine deacetylase/succinyl-diaminopimelate desuccinylase-like protein